MNKFLLLAAVLVLVGTGCLSDGPATRPSAADTTGVAAAVPDRDNPLTFDLAGGQFTVEKGITRISGIFEAEALAAQSEECGTDLDAAHFAGVLAKFDDRRVLQYDFLYRGDSQEPTDYVLTVVENGPGYATLDEFKRDFDICAAGGNLYPHALNGHWLVFASSCGSGADDGSGRPIGCEMISERIEGTLELH